MEIQILCFIVLFGVNIDVKVVQIAIFYVLVVKMEFSDLQSEKSLLVYVEEVLTVLWSKFQLHTTIIAPTSPAENFMLKFCLGSPPPCSSYHLWHIK